MTSHYYFLHMNEHRPDEKGIATADQPAGLTNVVRNEHRPDEKGIATPSCLREVATSPERTQT